MAAKVFDDSKEEYVFKCRKYAESFDDMKENGIGILLHGTTGTGKTHIAVCIANYLFDTNSVRFTSLSMLFSGYYARSFELRDQWLNEFATCDLLIIDDFGVERITDGYYPIIFTLIDLRINAKKPMVVTTNKSIDDFESEIGTKEKRLATRILEGCYPIEVNGKNWRSEVIADRRVAMHDFFKCERGCKDD